MGHETRFRVKHSGIEFFRSRWGVVRASGGSRGRKLYATQFFRQGRLRVKKEESSSSAEKDLHRSAEEIKKKKRPEAGFHRPRGVPNDRGGTFKVL